MRHGANVIYSPEWRPVGSKEFKWGLAVWPDDEAHVWFRLLREAMAFGRLCGSTEYAIRKYRA